LIVAKPIQSTLFAFIGFVVFSILLITMALIQIVNSPVAPWYSYLTVIVLSPLSVFLLYKMAFNYKIIEFDPKLITIRYPLKKATKTFAANQLASWGEAEVKTGKASTFKELEIRFADRTRITMGHREYSNYDRTISYLKKYAGNKEQSVLG